VWLKSSNHFEIDIVESRRKFFMSVNIIFSKCKLMYDLVKLKIFENYCLPLLLYGTDSGFLDDHDLNVFNCCWNSVCRKVFDYSRWESVKNVIAAFSKLNVVHMVNLN